MEQLLIKSFVGLVAFLALTACGRKDNSIEPASSSSSPSATSSTSAQASASAASTPLPGVIPVSPTLPGATGTGPAEGSTAIGGMTGKQEAGGQNKGAPAPTGGDAAPSSPSK